MPDYSTQPANIMPGLQMFSQGLQQYGRGVQRKVDFERERVKGKKTEKLREQAVNVFQTGDPKIIAEFVIKNPGAKDIYTEMLGAKHQTMVDEAKRWLIDNEDPVEMHTKIADEKLAAGEDITDEVDDIRSLMVDQEGEREKREKILAIYDPKAFDAYQVQRGEGDGDTELKIGAQEILEDGTVIQSTPQGPVVYNPEGVKVTGKAAADAVARARAEKVSNQRKAAGERKTATLEAEQELKGKVEAGVISQKEAAKISTKAFDRLEKINMNLRNLEEGIGLLREEGANTGVVDKYLPSLKRATIKMDNLQGRLGLDVLNTTTFGALSAGELKFALDTAVPKGLQPKDLANWLEEKKEAQEKLADYLESAAIYLGTPGNTVAGWIEKKRAERKNAETPKTQGPTLQDFLQKASVANPGVSQQELTDYYNKKYGGL